MRRSLAIAAAVAAGGGAASVAAASLPSFLGADALLTVTQSAIAACGAPANTLVYLGTGTGNGETAMFNGAQEIGPASSFLDANICTVSGGLSELQTAQGLVIGLDGLSILGSNTQTGSVACNGSNSTTCTPEATGLAYATSVLTTSNLHPAYTYTFTSWKDVLLVLYTGQSNASQNTATGDSGCNSDIRNTLANNWGTLFQNAAAPASPVASPSCASGGTCTILQHAFRRDDSAAAASVLLALIGASPSPTSESNRDFGTSPFCNVNEVGVKAATNTSPISIQTSIPHGLGAAGATATVTIVGVGKNIDNTVASGGNTAANGNNLTVTIVDGTHFTINGSTGNGSVVGSYAMVLLPPPPGLLSTPVPTDYRELDVIRRPCASAISAREDVCNRDGKLGLVLPVVPTDFLGSIAAQYPTTTCTATNFSVAGTTVTDPNSGFAVKVPCPNGEPQHGGNLCVMPTDPSGNTNCLNTTGNVPFAFNTAAVNGILPGAADARVYNSHLLTGVGAAGNYQVDTFGRSIIGAWYRIHSAHTLAPGGTKCLQSDVVNQMGCLVQASPCSLGADAHDATNWDLGAGSTIALKINQILPLAGCVQSFDYPLSRKLYLNTIVGWGNVIADDATYGPDELALAQCEASEAFIAPILTTNHFFNFAAGSSPNSGNPFAEDFNEPALCPTQAPPGTTANTIAYTNNASVGVVNASTGTTLPAVGTICGNGVLEPYEDCDDGTNGATGTPNTYVPLNGGNGHGTSAYPCSTTCRWANSPAPVDPGTLPCTTSTSPGTACTRSDGVTAGRCYVVTAGPTCLP
jgi:hypothetical protein